MPPLWLPIAATTILNETVNSIKSLYFSKIVPLIYLYPLLNHEALC